MNNFTNWSFLAIRGRFQLIEWPIELKRQSALHLTWGKTNESTTSLYSTFIWPKQSKHPVFSNPIFLSHLRWSPLSMLEEKSLVSVLSFLSSMTIFPLSSLVLFLSPNEEVGHLRCLLFHCNQRVG